MAERIVPVHASEQFRKDYIEYALYVERHRVVPEFRDGLKPVHRRIIYAARFRCRADEANRKCADVIGQTMGKYHPHGDASIQGALYGMINWFQTKYPLFKGKGNFGNTYQNVPAAPRYTEVKINKFTEDCILDELVKCKEVVDWEPNYDNSCLEPSFLPCKLPLLLINGCNGIAVGDKVDIPSHNICEVIDATIALIQNPNTDIVLVPDMCQACEIVDTNWADICHKGNGTFKVRGIVVEETYNGIERKYQGYKTLVIKSVPNLTFLETVIEKLEKMIKENKIIGIVDMEEQSTEYDMRFVLVLKPGTDPNYIRNELYKNTALMQTLRVNLKVLDINDKQNPAKRLSYRGYLQAWIDFRKLTKLRYFENLLQKKMTRLHMISLYIDAIVSGKSEEIIKMIKNNKSTDDTELIELLIKKLGVTDIQAKFFINCELKRLSKGYLKIHQEEAKKLTEETNYYRDCILKDGAIENIIINELLEIKNKYGDRRKCKLISESEANGIAAGTFKIVITEGNFIKKIGETSIPNKPKNDSIKFVLVGDNSKSILLFDSLGRVFSIPISKIPFADKNSNGVDIRLINKYINASITSVIYEPVLEQFKKGFIVTLTKQGFIKRMTTTDFLSVPTSGLVYCKLDEGDSIIDLLIFGNRGEVIIYGSKKALRIDISDIPILKRNARGCVSMSSKTAQVEGMSVNNKSTDLVVVTRNGYINKIISDTVTKGRGKAGSNVIKLGKTDNIVSICGVNNNDTLVALIAPVGECVEIPIATIPNGASISTGIKMIKGEVVKVYTR